jgi:hypothetical protein
MMGQETFLMGVDSPAKSLLIPPQRPVPQHFSEPHLLRLPPVQDCFNDVRRKTGQWKEPADVGVRDTFLLGQIGNRLRLPALDPAPPPVRADERLDQRLVAARLRRRRHS